MPGGISQLFLIDAAVLPKEAHWHSRQAYHVRPEECQVLSKRVVGEMGEMMIINPHTTIARMLFESCCRT